MAARGHKDEAINRNCGGNSTKIHLVVNSNGLANRFLLTSSAEHASKLTIDFIDYLFNSRYIIADKGYVSEALRDKKAKSIILRKKHCQTRIANFLNYTNLHLNKLLCLLRCFRSAIRFSI